MVWLVLGFCVWCTIESVCLDVVWFGLRVLNSWGCISGLDFVCRWVGVFGVLDLGWCFGVVWLWVAFGLIWCLDRVSCRV